MWEDVVWLHQQEADQAVRHGFCALVDDIARVEGLTLNHAICTALVLFSNPHGVQLLAEQRALGVSRCGLATAAEVLGERHTIPRLHRADCVRPLM